jgi:DNA helicase II / ATP-dependent DNA helicase PcrA
VNEYERAYKLLNKRQKQAVEQIDGPVLVIAGPGTGKTQLLSTRVGYILQNTDALPQNILCLTFTEAGVDAMRERLTKFLGQDAYDVNISTYHAFGSELIRRYPEYAAMYDFEPIDELGADSLLREILDKTAYSNPLRWADTYARDLRSFISDAKRALLTPDDLEAITGNNLKFIDASTKVVKDLFRSFIRIGKDSLALFEELHQCLEAIEDGVLAPVVSIKTLALDELQTALEAAAATGKTKEITAWKNAWLAKDTDGKFIFAGDASNKKINAAAGIYRTYQDEMTARKLYDYDDMILRAIKALEEHPDFKFTLAEQYLYIMLDEFQDTNAAQMRIVELLTDNPVNEGRPNVMAVGDDDQAIYAFQGAELTNMARFATTYKGVRITSLEENYRSHKKILDIAHNIGEQVEERLHTQFEGVTKKLIESSTDLPAAIAPAHHQFISDAAQYAWVAEQIEKLLAGKDVQANDIAVLAPKHKHLIPILPFLASKDIPVRYEKRENVIDKPINIMVEQMSRLVMMLKTRERVGIDSLWPEVLSYDFWQLPTEFIWEVSWEASASKKDWTNLLLSKAKTKDIATFFLRLKDLMSTTNLEQQLDILIGASDEDAEEFQLPIRSPFFEYYFGGDQPGSSYLELLSDLSVLRGRLRQWRRQETRPQNLEDYVLFINSHRSSGLNILNSNPHHQAEQAVNIMTAYQAKGREFEAVFILAAQDEVWGSSSRSKGSTISLPPNLAFIRYRGASEDERLRLFYVAITRAKHYLYLTSYSHTLDGKASRPLKYLSGNEELFDYRPHSEDSLSLETIESYWHHRHHPPLAPKLQDLLAPKLDKYQMSPTHLNQFTDLVYGGPQDFFRNTILRFPKGQAPAAQYGTVIHNILKWVHMTNAAEGRVPGIKRILANFDDQLALRRLAPNDFELLRERGHLALSDYMKLRGGSFDKNDKFEAGFRNEGVFVGDAHMAGNIDKLRFDKKNKTITIYDFKTGPSYDKWTRSNATLHKYRQQLMIYKMLIERSHTYKGWRVDRAVLEFVEPTPGEGRVYELDLEFDDQEMAELEKLIQAVWKRIKTLDFPDTNQYPKTITGIKKFEEDLIS